MSKVKDKRTIIAIAAAAAVVILIAVCIIGGGASGKWYRITSNPATTYGNMEFKFGGTFVTDGLEGKWHEENGIVQVDMMGIHRVYTIGKYDGHKVLYEEGRGYPSYCNSISGAEEIYNSN